MIATIPLFTPFTAHCFFRQKISVNKYLGNIVSFFGVLLVIYIDGSAGQAPLIGIALMIIAILSTQGYAVFLKRLSDSYNVFSIISIQNMIGALYFIPVFFVHEAKEFTWKTHTLRDYLQVFYLAIFASTFAFLLFAKGIKSIGLTRAIVFTNFIPVVTSIFAVFILNEVMGLTKVAGIILTIAGVLMLQVGSYPKVRIFRTGRKK
jgi:drug/metabolite transporter (DMT)-like permease